MTHEQGFAPELIRWLGFELRVLRDIWVLKHTAIKNINVYLGLITIITRVNTGV